MKRLFSILVLVLVMVTSACAADKKFGYTSEKVYGLFLKQDFKGWKGVIDNFHKDQAMSIDSLDFVLALQYYYVAWTVSDDTIKAGASKALNAALLDLARFSNLISQLPKKSYTRNLLEAKAKSYQSAFLAYQMKMAPVKVVVNGWKCVNNAKSAVTDMPDCWFSQIEYGNVMQSLPTVLGGSKINARKAYLKAQKTMESDSEGALTQHNWLYLHLLLCIADCYKNAGEYDKVEEYYNKILTVEPEYSYVRDVLKPSLAKLK